ncbi:MAG TPA: alpha-L-fucosidase [Gemmatimonadaceae bacterium]|nr:alpha-L-fucosidase [Gemmatimonadaceae bacterium]
MNRRSFLQVTTSAFVACSLPPRGQTRSTPLRPRPSPSPAQLAWQRDELALFLHFGVNTFTDREWGDGKEDPSIFSPSALDARQWARAARNAGARSLILTAKHHDGFCLWPTHTTNHSVSASPWRSGQGDVVREFADACHAEGLKAGLYLSPWDRNNPAYGDSPKYNDLYCDQLTELLTRYGPITEVWFDGANGEGPNGKRQIYDWPRFFRLVRQLQPNAVMFSDAGPDVRWCGNEKGIAGDPNWSTVNPDIVTFPGADGPGVSDALQHGDPAGTVWRPAEVDVSIRPGWFYHPAEDDKVRTVDNLESLYFSSVGRNGKLLLNVPPTRDGLLHSTDVARLAGFRARLTSLFERDLARDARRTSSVIDTGKVEVELDLGRAVTVAVARLEEDIRRGQSVALYTLYGAVDRDWQVLSRGLTIGYAKLDRFKPVTVRRVRIAIENAAEMPQGIGVKLYNQFGPVAI